MHIIQVVLLRSLLAVAVPLVARRLFIILFTSKKWKTSNVLIDQYSITVQPSGQIVEILLPSVVIGLMGQK